MPRKLIKEELRFFQDHLLRLDQEAKRLRFKNGAADRLIPDYVKRIHLGHGKEDEVLGKFHVDSKIVGAVHIGIVRDIAELGFSVEEEFRGKGLGRVLFHRGAEAAKDMGAKQIYTDCFVFNKAMMGLARSFGMDIEKEGTDAEAVIHLSKIYSQGKGD